MTDERKTSNDEPTVKLVDGRRVMRYKGGTRKKNIRTHVAVEDFELQEMQRERVRVENETWQESNQREISLVRRGIKRR